MLRCTFHILAFLSFLLLTAVVALWVKGHYVADHVSRFKAQSILQAQLDRRIPEATFDGVGLSDVVDLVPDMAGVMFEVDWNALEAAGVGKNSPVTIHDTNRSFAYVLAQICDRHSLAYTIEDGTLRITTRQAVRRGSFARHPACPLSQAESELPGDDRLGIVEWPAHLSPLDQERHSKGPAKDPPPTPVLPNNSLADNLAAISDKLRIPIDVRWPDLQSLGISPDSPVNGAFHGPVAQALDAALHQASLSDEVRYEYRDGRITIALRQWFDAQEQPILWTTRLSMIGVAALVLLLLVRRRRQRRSTTQIWLGMALLAALAVAWSISRTPNLTGRVGDKQWAAIASDNTLTLLIEPTFYEPEMIPAAPPSPRILLQLPHALLTVRRAGLADMTLSIAASLPALTMLLALLPALWLFRGSWLMTRRLLRRHAGRCLHCGYDLRYATGVCPECGVATTLAPAGTA